MSGSSGVNGGAPTGTEKRATPSSRRSNRSVQMPVKLLVALLTIGTGAIDAIVILNIGDAFASVMTGNLVFAGLAVGTWSGDTFSHVLAAVAGYVIAGGVASFASARLRREAEHEIWPARVTILLSAQAIVLVGVAIWWFVARGEMSYVNGLAVLAVSAGAMGIQSAAVKGIGISASTTYLTGALTNLIESIATRRPFDVTQQAAVLSLVSLVAGAAIGGFISLIWPPISMVVPTTTLAAVVIVSFVFLRLARAKQRRAS